MVQKNMLNVLTIAGSDCSGGAGIQADLKTFSALGVYGASVITALTAQNTRCVTGIHVVPAAFVSAQLAAIFEDITISAVKIGMLANAATIHALVQALHHYRPAHIILDTIMVSKGHAALLEPEAIQVLRDELLPLCELVTPNLPEAAALLGEAPATDEPGMVRQGQALHALGAQAVLIKGGHLDSRYSPDWLISAAGNMRLPAERLSVSNTHGTGCTLSAAIAALRPQRLDLVSAVSDAKTYLTGALMHSTRLNVGQGVGPVHHCYTWW